MHTLEDLCIWTAKSTIKQVVIGDFSGEFRSGSSAKQFMDYGFGCFFHNENVMVGISGHHLTQPNISFLDEPIAALAMKVSAQWRGEV